MKLEIEIDVIDSVLSVAPYWTNFEGKEVPNPNFEEDIKRLAGHLFVQISLRDPITNYTLQLRSPDGSPESLADLTKQILSALPECVASKFMGDEGDKLVSQWRLAPCH